jgi:DNA-binding phage protein
MLPFEGVFANSGLFRNTRAWCPACYEDWRRNDDPIYEPLLWAIRSAAICPRHGQPFEHACPHCGETMLSVGAYTRPGHCSRCLQWLGRSGRYKPASQPDDHARNPKELWRANAVAELLAAAPQLNISGAAFKANLRACIQDVAEGNLLAFAKAVQLSRPGLDRLTYGKSLPELATLLQICHRAEVPLAVFLADHPVADAATWDQLKQALQTGRKGCRVPLARSREQVRAAMRQAIHELPPPSLSEIAQRLNYKGVEGLRDVDNALSKQLAANYLKSGRSHWWRKPGATRICGASEIRAILEQSLSEIHPRSLYELAVNLGYVNEGYIQSKFPQLCGAIRQKIRKNKEMRISAMERALENALNDEPPPSLDNLRRQLGYSCSTVLKNHFPVLCNEIMTRRRLHRRQMILELKRALRSALLDVPAPSLVSLCRTLNTPEHALEKMCPRECASIRARYRRAREEASVRRKEQLRLEVRKIMQMVHSEGNYPTIKQVRILLRQRNNWAEVSTSVSTVRKELRVTTQTSWPSQS